MNLRKKTLIVVGLFLVSSILILYAASELQLENSFSDLEERNAKVDVDRALNAMSNELTCLGDLASFWSARDDIYAFVTTKDIDYINYSMSVGSLTNDSLNNTEINLLLFLDAYGQIAFCRFLNVSGTPEEVPHDLIEQLSLYGFCPGCLDKKSQNEGMILLSGQPMMIVTQPITTSKKDSPIMGRVVLGRFLTQREIDRLSEIAQLNLTIYPLYDPEMPENFRQALSQLSYDSSEFIVTREGETIAGYALMANIYGNPLMIMGVNASREIYRQGAQNRESFMFLFSAAGFLFMVLTLIYLDRSVLSRLANLTTSIISIGKAPEASTSLMVQGEDELSNLAVSINDMLAGLKSAHKALVNSEKRYRGVVEDIPDLICRYSSDGIINFANASFCAFFSAREQEILSQKIDGSAWQGHLKSARELEDKINEKYPILTYESQYKAPEGLRWILWTARGIFDQAGSLAEIQSVGRDITSIRKAEEALRESEERYQLLAENMTDVIHLNATDENLSFVYVSPSIKQSGYNPVDLIGRSPFDTLIESEDVALVKSFLKGIIDSKKEDIIEYRIRMIEGSSVWVETIANPILDEEGNAMYIACTSRDITERKKADGARKKSEERYQLLAENMTDVIHLNTPDPDLTYVYISPSIRQAGYEPSELIGRSPFEKFFQSDDKEIIKQSLNRLLATKGPEITEYRVRSRNGSCIWVETISNPILDREGNVIYIASSTRDITQRKKAEAARRESEERYLLLAENMTDVIHLHTPDPELRFAYVSPSIRIAGYEPSELVGKPAIGLFFGPEGAEIIGQALRRFLETKRGEVIEYPAIMKDGSRRWVETISSPVFDKEGNLIYIANSSRDITSRKRAEEALKESQQQMADIISFLPEAIMAIDLNGKVMIWNQAMEGLTGVLARDILGKGDYEYSLPFYGYRRPILVDMVLEPHEGWEAEYLGFKREGTAVLGEVFIPTFGPHGSYLLAKATALCDEIGNTVGAIESVRDMTEWRIMEQKLERDRTELHVAAEIQRSFIPKTTPDIANFEVAAVTIPAMEVGGDFYDFIALPHGHHGLVIADVAGKSIPAALFMALSRMIIRASAAQQSLATEVLRNANNMIASDATAGMFVTLLFGILDGEALTLKYANAGHPPPLIFKSRDGSYEQEVACGIALGAREGVSYEEQVLQFGPGDVAVFYTDGVTEAMNPKGELFGMKRLIAAVSKTCQSPAEEIMARILEEVSAFREDREQNDDITLIVLKASPKAEEHSFISVHSRDEEIPKVSQELERSMSRAGFSGKQILDMQLAVEEAFINIVRHGYKGAYGAILIAMDIEEGRLRVTIEDDAPPFDPTGFQEPDFSAELEERPVGGLGIHLMRSLSDEMRYEYENGKNRLMLIKIKDQPSIKAHQEAR
jgi:PAS domain S-box-containing protein